MWGSISPNSRMLNPNIDVPKYSEPSKISLGYPNYPKIIQNVVLWYLLMVYGFIHLMSLTIYFKLDAYNHISKCSSRSDTTFCDLKCTKIAKRKQKKADGTRLTRLKHAGALSGLVSFAGPDSSNANAATSTSRGGWTDLLTWRS